MMFLPKAKNADVVQQEIGDEVLIYNLITKEAYCLNQSAKMVFELCDGKRNIPEISKLLSRKLKTLIGEDFVRLTLNELQKHNLIDAGAEISLSNQSRREMIKKVGLATMAALPLISSVVAPQAVHAASTCGQVCGQASDCAGGTCPNCVGAGVCSADIRVSCTTIGSPCNTTDTCNVGGFCNSSFTPCTTNAECAGTCFLQAGTGICQI